MNSDTAASLLVLLIVGLGLAILALVFVPRAAGAETVCLSKKEARHLWPKRHIYWYGPNHCWSNRRGPPRGLKVDPIINHSADKKIAPDVRAEAAKPKYTAPLNSSESLRIIEDGCCWPKLEELLLDRWRALKGLLEK